MAVIGYLKLATIRGGSTARHHEDEIEIHAITWQVSQVTSTSGQARGRPEVGNVVMVKDYDVGSPYLAQAVVRGTAFPEARIALERGGDRHLDYLRITLTACRITDYEILPPDPAAGPALRERIALSFDTITLTYTEQKADGRPGKEHEVKLDVGR